MKKQTIILFVVLILTPIIQAETVGDTSSPLPNITEIAVHDVEGLSGEERLKNGESVDKGINKTFKLYSENEDRQYRFSFRIENEGSENFLINDSDLLYHEGIGEEWEVGRIWYNISGERKFEGNLSENRVEWNTSKKGVLGPGERMYAKYLVNITEKTGSRTNHQFNITESDTGTGSYDHHKTDIKKLGKLHINLIEPPEDTYIKKNQDFQVNTSAECFEGVCGDVSISVRHNTSEGQRTVSENSGTPFHTTEKNNPQTCNSLSERCFVSWDLNATGETESFHDLDTNVSSSLSSVEDNSSSKHTVEINQLIIMDLEFDRIDFGVLNPGAEKVPAKGNSDLMYNISFSEDSIAVDNLYMKSSPLISLKDDRYSIYPENVSASTENSYSEAKSLSESFSVFEQDISPGSLLTSYFFIDIPEGLLKGEYRGNITFKANSTV